MKEYRKIATVKAKLFEKGDEDGMIMPENFTSLDVMENNRYGLSYPDMIPYISTLENQKYRGKFGGYYLCVGVDGEKWLVEKDIFEKTYEEVIQNVDSDEIEAERRSRIEAPSVQYLAKHYFLAGCRYVRSTLLK